MRTMYDIESMATLCLQIYERGLNEWQPLLAAPNGEEVTYYIVSGHRRQMARLLAWALAAGATEVEIARNAGQKLTYVRNHLALTQLPPELAQRIAAGELPMGVGSLGVE